MARGVIRAGLLAAALLAPATGASACRLALVLALDVSGSVDAVEYRQQLEGVAGALESSAVRAALLAEPGRPVALGVFEWSASGVQREILPWSVLTDGDAIGRAAARLRAVRRTPMPNRTGLGGALEAGARALGAGPACERRVIDVSGDGRNNDWPDPARVRAGSLAGITVNALAILPGDGGDPAGLVDYFRAEVLHGPGAFVETASGYGDYARAMARKLLRETEAPRLGQARPLPPGRADASEEKASDPPRRAIEAAPDPERAPRRLPRDAVVLRAAAAGKSQ